MSGYNFIPENLNNLFPEVDMPDFKQPSAFSDPDPRYNRAMVRRSYIPEGAVSLRQKTSILPEYTKYEKRLGSKRVRIEIQPDADDFIQKQQESQKLNMDDLRGWKNVSKIPEYDELDRTNRKEYIAYTVNKYMTLVNNLKDSITKMKINDFGEYTTIIDKYSSSLGKNSVELKSRIFGNVKLSNIEYKDFMTDLRSEYVKSTDRIINRLKTLENLSFLTKSGKTGLAPSGITLNQMNVILEQLKEYKNEIEDYDNLVLQIKELKDINTKFNENEVKFSETYKNLIKQNTTKIKELNLQNTKTVKEYKDKLTKMQEDHNNLIKERESGHNAQLTELKNNSKEYKEQITKMKEEHANFIKEREASHNAQLTELKNSFNENYKTLEKQYYDKLKHWETNAEQQVAKLNQIIEELQNGNVTKLQEYTEAINKINSQKNEIIELTNEIKRLNDIIKNDAKNYELGLLSKTNLNNQNLDQYKMQLSAKDKEYQLKTESQQNNYNKLINEYKDTMIKRTEEFNTKTFELESLLQRSNNSYGDILLEVQNLKDDIDLKQQTIDFNDKELKGMRQTLHSAAADITALEDKNLQLQTELTSNSSKIKALLEKEVRFTTEKANIEKEKKALNDDNIKLQKQIIVLEKDLEKYTLLSKEKQISESQLLTEIQNQKKALQEQLEKLEKDSKINQNADSFRLEQQELEILRLKDSVAWWDKKVDTWRGKSTLKIVLDRLSQGWTNTLTALVNNIKNILKFSSEAPLIRDILEKSSRKDWLLQKIDDFTLKDLSNMVIVVCSTLGAMGVIGSVPIIIDSTKHSATPAKAVPVVKKDSANVSVQEIEDPKLNNVPNFSQKRGVKRKGYVDDSTNARRALFNMK